MSRRREKAVSNSIIEIIYFIYINLLYFKEVLIYIQRIITVINDYKETNVKIRRKNKCITEKLENMV